MLARLGVAALTVAALRSVRQVILPLWAVSIGVGEAETALVIGVAGGVDFALFWFGGWLMDRFGRLYTAVPSMIGLGLGLLGLALSAGGGARRYQGNYRDPVDRPAGELGLRWMVTPRWGLGVSASAGNIGAERAFDALELQAATAEDAEDPLVVDVAIDFVANAQCECTSQLGLAKWATY